MFNASEGLQLSLAPHFYCPGVSMETRTQCFQGAGQWEGFDNTVGYLTVSPGFCAGGKCKVGCTAAFACAAADVCSLLNDADTTTVQPMMVQQGSCSGIMSALCCSNVVHCQPGTFTGSLWLA